MIHAIVGTIAAGCVVGGFVVGIALILGPKKTRQGR